MSWDLVSSALSEGKVAAGIQDTRREKDEEELEGFEHGQSDICEMIPTSHLTDTAIGPTRIFWK